MNKYIKKLLFFSTIFVSIFFFSPKDTYAYNYVKCEVFTYSYERIAYGEDSACDSLNVPRQNEILDVIYTFKNKQLYNGNKYRIKFTWWYIGSSSWQIRHNTLNIGGVAVSNTGVNTWITDQNQYSQTMFLFDMNTEGEFTSPANSNEIVVDVGVFYSSNTIAIGWNKNLEFIQTSGGNSGTTSSDVASSINENNNRNTDRIINSQNEINSSIEDMNNDIMSDDTSESEDIISDFFGDFNQNAHGLSGVITAPFSLLNNLSTATCSPLEFNLPIVHNHVVLPCMKPIYENYFGVFYTLWQLITTGLISYNVCINFYKKIRDLQNPDNDRIEVLNL